MEKHGNPNQPKEVPYAPPKTVGVRDEAGNRYEATYARRAKGLVKNGRARFTDESQTEIILACPPNQKLILEDKIMTEQNTNIQATENQNDVAEKQVPQLTAKEIFDQIVALQNLMSCEHTNPLYSLASTVETVCESELEGDSQIRESIVVSTTPFRMREETYRQMLETYRQMYNDLKDQRSEYDRIKNVLLDLYERRIVLVKETEDLDDGTRYHLLQQLSNELNRIMANYQ